MKNITIEKNKKCPRFCLWVTNNTTSIKICINMHQLGQKTCKILSRVCLKFEKWYQ